MTSPSTRDKFQHAKATAGRVSDELRDSAEDALESGREYADDSIGRVSEKVRDLRRDIEPAIDHLRYRARRAARRGIDAAGQARDRTRETVNHYADVTGQYVSDQPVRSVLIAAAAGAVLAALVMAARGRDRH